MYKHILLPTDGSGLSEEASQAGIELARAVGARVTALHVLPEPSSVGIEGWTHGDDQFEKHLAQTFEKHGTAYLENIRDAARRAGVACECSLVRADAPEAEIIREARERRCDLIVMASHGRKGADAVVLASVTMRVATLGEVPVLIHRTRKR